MRSLLKIVIFLIFNSVFFLSAQNTNQTDNRLLNSSYNKYYCDGSVRGEVFDKNSKKRIQGATVDLFSRDEHIVTLLTDANGLFEYTKIDCSRTYDIVSYKEGFNGFAELHFIPENAIKIELYLNPVPPKEYEDKIDLSDNIVIFDTQTEEIIENVSIEETANKELSFAERREQARIEKEEQKRKMIAAEEEAEQKRKLKIKEQQKAIALEQQKRVAAEKEKRLRQAQETAQRLRQEKEIAQAEEQKRLEQEILAQEQAAEIKKQQEKAAQLEAEKQAKLLAQEQEAAALKKQQEEEALIAEKQKQDAQLEAERQAQILAQQEAVRLEREERIRQAQETAQRLRQEKELAQAAEKKQIEQEILAQEKEAAALKKQQEEEALIAEKQKQDAQLETERQAQILAQQEAVRLEREERIHQAQQTAVRLRQEKEVAQAAEQKRLEQEFIAQEEATNSDKQNIETKDLEITENKEPQELHSPERCSKNIYGRILNAVTQEPIEGTNIDVYYDGQNIESSRTASDGTFNFYNVDCNTSYTLIGYKKDYNNIAKIDIDTGDLPDEIIILLEPDQEISPEVVAIIEEPPVEENIQNQTEITEKAHVETVESNASSELVEVQTPKTDKKINDITIAKQEASNPPVAEVPTPIVKEPEKEAVEIKAPKVVNRKVQIDPIYFELDEWYLTLDARRQLDKIIVLMAQNPTMIIESGSHTDSRGSFDYNLELSEKRSQETVGYLIANGADPDRISGRGYGETIPVNHCVDGVKCTEREYLENRRTEFIILKY